MSPLSHTFNMPMSVLYSGARQGSLSEQKSRLVSPGSWCSRVKSYQNIVVILGVPSTNYNKSCFFLGQSGPAM